MMFLMSFYALLSMDAERRRDALTAGGDAHPNHGQWCALRRGHTTCDCDWFEQEARGFGHGPPGHREVVVPWPPPVVE